MRLRRWLDISDIELVKKIIPTLTFKFPYSAEDYVKNLYLENYHCHKDFSNTSTPDCAESINAYADRVHEFGTKCLYSGEHGSQGNQFQVYKVAESEHLKYIHSSEVYWVKDRKEKDRANCHMIVAAKNAEGRGDINFALSMANIDGYYYKPRIDLELLFNIPKDNVIVTSACVAGWNYKDAEDIWLKIHKYFGDNFFLEVQYHNTDKQKELNKKILRIAKEHNIQIICGLDSHYVKEENAVKRDQILKYKNINYPDEEGWYLDYPDTPTVIKRFEEQGVLNREEIYRAIMNTNVFVAECEEIVLDRKFKIPSVYKGKTYKEKCKIYKDVLNKAYAKEKEKSKEKADGIRYEAKQVMEAGVVDYFLTSKAIVDDAIKNEGGILTTTSRGSAASFITNKLLGLTTVDRFNADIPIYPERFLTKERVLAGQMPDIDLNVATQEPFVKAARKLLGEHGCYPLMAIEKLKEKAAWQLYAGANEVKPEDANQISKYLDEYNKALKYADEDEKDDIHVEDYIPEEYAELFKQSNEYQGITINLKVHACGHFIFDGDIRREVGLISAVSESTGKRTVCAAIEGGYLDEFGYVKEDFLIVDSVYLTYKFFHSIGMEVPTFDELRHMIDGDKKTWDIYANGITCCVNQCEKEATTNRVKKYKPQNLAELSSFIAAIRPGFASLLSTFLNREPYTTGEKKIDDLLSDTAHFMIYQESIMKVLSFLELKMAETYGVIKNISKKKYKLHPEMLKELQERLIEGWKAEIGKTDNFHNVWNVIESSGSYAFNSPHAYSMGGDSAYQAWFKAHHTKTFYEVAINHYQEKNKKDKIDALVKEAIKFWGYKLGDYEFGADNRKVTINEENKLIYPNLSSVKGFGEGVVDTLYELGQSKYKTFTDVLTALFSNSINKTIVNKLIRINYFKKYGDVNTLLEITRLYDLLNGAKQISKDKAEKNNIPFDILVKHGNETAKQFNKLDSEQIIKELISKIPCRELTLKERLDNQREVLGIVSDSDSKVSKRLYYVSELDIKKSIVNVHLFEIYSGKTREVKMWTSQYNRNPFDLGTILYIISLEKKNKKEPTGEINPVTGKKIYKEVPDKFEFWLSKFVIKNDIEEDEDDI
ncbi:PHP domain-containing protein [Coprococcus sp. RTP21281st1_F1_RTP21281_210402]|uniref:PHP domain-containing protein n=1 Tax=Coprococcus sp. RTP21281st1_F1_RTP21281_210402 TaxID=3143208 RepID=UPI0034A25DFC